MRKYGVFAILAGLVSASTALALVVVPSDDPVAMSDAIVSSSGAITITSATYDGGALASGTYTDGPSGIADGVILTSGLATNALGPNDADDTSFDHGLEGHFLCDDLAGFTTYDATLLTLTFDLEEGFNGISFQFVFGSEEYPEYVGTQFNDVMGVYLNGGQVAFDDNGDPITINGPFFSGVSGTVVTDNGTEYDGSTGLLTTRASLEGGSTGNTLDILICDSGDGVLDSGVFIALLNGCVGDDCSGTIPCEYVDDDGDGSDSCVDCDDTNPDINPDAEEECDAVDNNCDGEIDEDDVCCPDDDGDDVCNDDDICPGGDDNADADTDGVPDYCDACPGADDGDDIDGDGTPDECDDCPLDENDDSDGDGLCDSDDDCDGTADGALIDDSGCSIADYCPCDGDWANHGAYVSCVGKAATQFMKAGLITGMQRGAIQSMASRSDCGD